MGATARRLLSRSFTVPRRGGRGARLGALGATVGLACAQAALVAGASSAAAASVPTITAVHFSNIGPNMRIEVDGTGFGTPSIGLPYVGTVPNFTFSDTSRGGVWGGPGNAGLNFASWSRTTVVVNGFQQYNCGSNCIVKAGDQVSVVVKNATSGEFYTWSGTLATGGPAPTPTPSPAPAPVPAGKVLSLSFADVAPGGQQVATANVKPGSSAVLVVGYPNGTQRVFGPTVADASGHVIFTWAVPAGVKGAVHVTLVSVGPVAQATFVVS